EQVVGAAVQRRARHDVVARAREVEDRRGGGRRSGRERERGDTALERGHTLLEHVLRRARDPGVDVARLGEAEQVLTVLGVPEDVGRGLVDRGGPGTGGRVGLGTCVDLLGLERPTVGHRRLLQSWLYWIRR